MATAAVLAFALLRGAMVTKEGMPRRWWVAIRGWGVAYGVTLIVGAHLAARVRSCSGCSPPSSVTAPLAVGAWREGRA